MRWVLDIFFPIRASARLVRTLKPAELDRLVRPKRIGSVITLLPYRDPLVQALITEAKFFGNKTAQRALGSVLASFLNEQCTTGTHILVPVPLSTERFKRRGYNQVEEICRAALQELPPIFSLSIDILTRNWDTRPQTSLNGMDRRQNLEGAFSVLKSLDPDHTYILIDDVVTTRTTLSEACTTLKMAQVQRIIPIAVAH